MDLVKQLRAFANLGGIVTTYPEQRNLVLEAANALDRLYGAIVELETQATMAASHIQILERDCKAYYEQRNALRKQLNDRDAS